MTATTSGNSTSGSSTSGSSTSSSSTSGSSTSSSSTSSRSTSRFWLIMAAALVLVVLVVGGSGADGPPYDPRSVNPDGAKGIVETLERLGAQVDLDNAVPSPDATTALMLRDRLTEADEQAVNNWVFDGGVLVVATGSSNLAAQVVGITPGFGASTMFQGRCTIDALAEVNRLQAAGSVFDTEGAESCFGDGERAFVVASSYGRGTIVSVGSAEVFTNAVLDEEDTAVLAIALLAPNRGDAHVTFIGPSIVEFGEEGLTDLIPTRVWNAIWQLMAAFLLYGLYRARRLGGVVSEPIPVRIEGSELVLKAGVLSQRAADPASAAHLLRDDARQRARKALSVAPTVTDDELSEHIVAHTGLDIEQVRTTLSSLVSTEDDLVRVAHHLSEIDDLLYGPEISQPLADQPNPEKASQ